MRIQILSRVLLPLLLTAGCCGILIADDTAKTEFGVTPFFKGYPEFKQGIDPYANFSGTMQENVDHYGGNLSLTFPLPAIPWSATKGFAPVLLYKSSIWGYRQETGFSWTDIGLGKTTEPPPSEFPRGEKTNNKVPDYWGHDNWLRFSLIGQRHNLPGWSLPIGGVYTEITRGTEGMTAGDWEMGTIHAVVEKKYFVAPDGSSHLMVDMETSGRPYFITSNPSGAASGDCTFQSSQNNSISIRCLPERFKAGASTRIWHAIDGSGYYFIENLPTTPDTPTGTVYGKDGTSYELDSSGLGYIRRITDLDGNSILINIFDGPDETEVDEYGTIVDGSGGQPSVIMTKHLTWTSTNTGASLLAVFKMYQPFSSARTGVYRERIAFPVLIRLEASAANGEKLIYRFGHEPLGRRLGKQKILFKDVMENTLIQTGTGSTLELPTYTNVENQVFFNENESSDTKLPPPNAQIYILRSIILPGRYPYSFEYNIAGRLCKVTYPDGGYRRYEYGNWGEPSTNQKDYNVPSLSLFPGKVKGAAPYGGVGIVYQNGGTGERVERCYAYSGYREYKNVATLCWMADGSSQLYYFFSSETMDLSYRNIIQFGMSGWKTGKLQRVEYFGIPAAPPSLTDDLKQKFLCVDSGGVSYLHSFPALVAQCLGGSVDLDDNSAAGENDDVRPVKEEETIYQNFDAGWHWTLPEDYCLDDGACGRTAMHIYYDQVIPPAPTYWSTNDIWRKMLIPEWNLVTYEKITRVYEGGDTPQVKRVKYVYDHITGPVLFTGGPLMKEYQSRLIREEEYTGEAAEHKPPVRTKQYTAEIVVNDDSIKKSWYWPSATPKPGMPARVLDLPLEEKILDANGAELSRTTYTYDPADPSTASARIQLHPVKQQQWLDDENENSAAFTATGFAYTIIEGSKTNPFSVIRPLSVTTFQDDNTTPLFTMSFEYDKYRLLRKVSGAPADGRDAAGGKPAVAASAPLYMMLEYDPGTGLLKKRTDTNGNRNGNKIIDSADDYIYFAYDDYNRLSSTNLYHSGQPETLSEVSYSAPCTPGQPCSPYSVTTTQYLDANTTRTARVQNDPLGRAAFSWASLGKEGGSVQYLFTRKTFDVLGRVVAESWPEKVSDPGTISAINVNRQTTMEYDGLGRTVKTTKPAPDEGFCSATTAFAIVDGLLRTTVTGEDNRWRKLYHDALGRLVQVKEPLPGSSALPLDDDDDEEGWFTRYTYDTLDRLTGVNKLKPEDAVNGQVRQFRYDQLGRLMAAQLPEYDALTMHYTYDLRGNLTNKTIGSSFDTPPVLAGRDYDETMTYDAYGRLRTRALSLHGVETNYQYWYDRVRTAAEPDPQPELPPNFNPGAWLAGRLVADQTIHDDNTPVTRWFGYDWQGRPSGKAERLGAGTGAENLFLTAYPSYDRAGNLRRVVYPSGQQAVYEYGAGGGLTATALMNTGQGGGTDRENLFTIAAYASHGAVARALLGCQGGQTGWGQSWNRALLPARLLLGEGLDNTNYSLNLDTMDLAGGNISFALDYSKADGTPGYEDGGNIISVKRFAKIGGVSQPVLSFTYGYDALNRLQTADFTKTGLQGLYGYTMDAWGNLTAQEKKSGSSPSAPAGRTMPVALAANGVPVTNRLAGQDYDILGNMTSHSATIEGQTQSQTLEYLDQGHIARILTGSGATLATAWRYYYDADGKRRIKAEGPAPGTGTPPLTPAEAFTNSSFSFYAGEDLICQLDTGTQVAESAPGVPDPDTYGPKFLLTDHLGTTRAELTFNSSHSPVISKIYDYMPYGEEISPAADVTEQVKFTGKQRDSETGLDYFGSRSLIGNIGRWDSTDPVHITKGRLINPGQLNLYSYCGNDPINNFDPDGEDAVVDNPNDRAQVQADLQKLAPGTKLDANGKVVKAGFFRRVWNHLTGHAAGQSLVNRMVNDHKVLVHISLIPGKNDAYCKPATAGPNGVKQINVDYDPNLTLGVETRTPDSNGHITNTSPIQDLPLISAGVLGHELIHADHQRKVPWNRSSAVHSFGEGTNTWHERWYTEEFRTVGFKGFTRPGDITENKLRKELGLNPRATYLSRSWWF